MLAALIEIVLIKLAILFWPKQLPEYIWRRNILQTQINQQLFQMLCEVLLNFKVIFKSVQNPYDNLTVSSGYVGVKTNTGNWLPVSLSAFAESYEYK